MDTSLTETKKPAGRQMESHQAWNFVIPEVDVQRAAGRYRLSRIERYRLIWNEGIAKVECAKRSDDGERRKRADDGLSILCGKSF
jgi:hypothetical protein